MTEKRLLCELNREAQIRGYDEQPQQYQGNGCPRRSSVCPLCGSDILRYENKSRLAHFVDKSDLGFNYAVADAAGVPKAVVSDLQKFNGGKMSEKKKLQAEAVAKCLGVPSDILFSLDPDRSTVTCMDCGMRVPLSTWRRFVDGEGN